MSGYQPGEQPPRGGRLVKLNTNENPYPPAPGVRRVLQNFDASLLRLYPDPVFKDLSRVISGLCGRGADEIIVGNGSDDLLTMALRSFTSAGRKLSVFTPSYSLYSVLAKIQDCECDEISLDEKNGFSLPDDAETRIADASLLIICRPNAPTGNSFPLDRIASLIDACNGVAMVDEAYADFSDDNCLELCRSRKNAILMRTLSKSYSLAGLRLGYALAAPEIISGMMKVKDSYNVGMLSQVLAIEALSDRSHFEANLSKILKTRAFLSDSLSARGFRVFPSQSNFVLVEPPSPWKAEKLYQDLKRNGVLVRHFSVQNVDKFLRITVGTDNEIKFLLEQIDLIVPGPEGLSAI